jgi:hypothetical protein
MGVTSGVQGGGKCPSDISSTIFVFRYGGEEKQKKIENFNSIICVV